MMTNILLGILIVVGILVFLSIRKGNKINKDIRDILLYKKVNYKVLPAKCECRDSYNSVYSTNIRRKGAFSLFPSPLNRE